MLNYTLNETIVRNCLLAPNMHTLAKYTLNGEKTDL